ncbi:MAG: UbiA family prenyltransferase [Kiritimatiellia bacterium]
MSIKGILQYTEQKNAKIFPWLRLLRVPNLLTVPGDPVAGYLLVAAVTDVGFSWSLVCAAGASVCLYCFGLVLNDMVDLKVDLCERPERPLPSGEISFNSARGVAVAFALSGLNLALFAGGAVFYAATALSAFILLYNAGLKNVRFFGTVVMGLCRGGSFMLGVFAALSSPHRIIGMEGLPALTGFAAITLTFIGITAIARHEMDAEKSMGFQRMFPFAALLITLPGLAVVLSMLDCLMQPAATVYVFLMVMTLMRAWFLGGVLYRTQAVPLTVGGHIRNHLMLQACLCSAAGTAGFLPALILVAASQAFALLSKQFYSS